MGALPHDPKDNFHAPFDPYGAATHEVFNQPAELVDTNLYAADAALKEAVRREGAAWADDGLVAFGARAGLGGLSRAGRAGEQEPA